MEDAAERTDGVKGDWKNMHASIAGSGGEGGARGVEENKTEVDD